VCRLTRELAERERLAALGRVAAGGRTRGAQSVGVDQATDDLAQRTAGLPETLTRDSPRSSMRSSGSTASWPTCSRSPRAGLAIECQLTWAHWWRNECQWRRHGAPPRNVEIQLNTIGDPQASVDPDAVARAVDNLMRNAVEASPPSMAVRVEVQGKLDMVHIAVMDFGPGVPSERQHELFEPFFTTKPKALVWVCRYRAA